MSKHAYLRRINPEAAAIRKYRCTDQDIAAAARELTDLVRRHRAASGRTTPTRILIDPDCVTVESGGGMWDVVVAWRRY